MVWIIPNTFIAGTKAKANEVNENFTSAKQFMDNLETEQATNTADILQLEQNKADLNGNFEQRFQVANATNSFDAINKQTLLNLVSNTQEVIKGFVLSKFNNTTVSATAGSCYDSTFVYMIASATSLSKAQENLGNNAKYYVYVCADKDTGNCELVISLSNTTPELPGGYEYYRQLGYFTTDGSGKISQVLNNSDTVAGKISANGYITLNGLVTIQWGYADVNLNNNSVDINLPVAYKRSHLCCVCSPNNSWSNGDWDRICIGCQPVSLSKIRFIGGRSAAYRVYYISIGI
jgi:hypothetical protein